MRISIIYTSNSPFKAFLDSKKAIEEYERLRDLDDFVDYSVMELPVEDNQESPCTYADGVRTALKMYRADKSAQERETSVKLLIRTKQPDASQQAKCFWELDDTEGYYNTRCAQAFSLEEGTPEDNNFQYCCFCGGRLEF